MSPIAMKEKWREKANTAEGRVLHFPINSVRYMLASKLDFVANFENLWDFALIETPEPVSLPYLAKSEGGYIDSWRASRSRTRPATPSSSRSSPRSWVSPSRPTGRTWDAGCDRSKPSRSRRSRSISRKRSRWPWRDHMVVAIDLGTCSRAARCATCCSAPEPRGQAGRSRRAHQGVHIDEGRDPHPGGDRPAERQDPGRFRRVARPDQGSRQGADFRGARENGMMLDRDEELGLLARGQGGHARGAVEHQGAADADRPDPLPRGDTGPQRSRIETRRGLPRDCQCLLDPGLEGRRRRRSTSSTSACSWKTPYR